MRNRVAATMQQHSTDQLTVAVVSRSQSDSWTPCPAPELRGTCVAHTPTVFA